MHQIHRSLKPLNSLSVFFGFMGARQVGFKGFYIVFVIQSAVKAIILFVQHNHSSSHRAPYAIDLIFEALLYYLWIISVGPEVFSNLFFGRRLLLEEEIKEQIPDRFRPPV